MKELYDNQENVIPLIWQGDTANISPGYTQRANSYGVGGIPHAQFNGYLTDIGGGSAYPRYLNIYNNLIGQNSPIELNVQFNLSESGEIQLVTDALVTGEITTSNNKIVYLITRHLSNDYFASVASFETEDFTLSTVGEEETFVYDLPINPEWDYDNLSIAILVQTFDDDPAPNKHKILQGVYHPFNELMIPIAISELDFGEVEVGESVTQSIPITNFFDTAMTVLVISASGFETEMMINLPAHTMQLFDITFSPTQAISYHADLIFSTDNELFPNLFVTVNGTGIGENDAQGEQITDLPIQLMQNYPNPFNPSTKISFHIDENQRQQCKLIIFNSLGQKIRSFKLAETTENYIWWNGANEVGKKVKSGIYFYQLHTGNNTYTKRMILLK